MASKTDYSGVNAPFGIHELGATYLTELAREKQQLQDQDPIKLVFPDQDEFHDEVRVEWTEEELRLIGVVNPGQPNRLDTVGKGKTIIFQSATFRRGGFIDMKLINTLRAAGGDAQKKYGIQMVSDRMTNLIAGANRMFSLLRAQMLSGGINYTDPENGNVLTADSGIPNANYYTIGSGVMTGSAHWMDYANAKPVSDVQTMLYRMELEGKVAPTHVVMGSAVREALGRNAEVRANLPGNTNGLPSLGLVTLNAQGKVDSICGIKIVVHNMVYDDLVGGTLERQYMWPVNKIAFLSLTDPQTGEHVARTRKTLGEHPQGLPGMYVRSGASDPNNLDDATQAPGVRFQVGDAGLPVLLKPWWVHVVTVATVQQVKDALGTKYIL